MQADEKKLQREIEKAKKLEKFNNKKKFVNTGSDKVKNEVTSNTDIISTACGEKKDINRELPKSYCPKYTEEGWFSWWDNQGYFKPEYNQVRSDETFTIMIPPPNVTGVLHIGHALTLSIEDCIVRWNRMLGKQTLWLPGTDHAGIATQTVVEKKLMREQNVTRHDLGREKFVDEVWKWKNEKGDRIIEQLKKMGSSCDFSRLRFTMDESMSTAVKEAFVRLFESGSIYRAKRLVHWSCALRSAISDIEVEKVEIKGRTMVHVPGYERPIEFGLMVTFVYVVENSGERLEVATTRIETILGDTAIAVHPEDKRYTHLHGHRVVHPFRNGETIPIVLDTAVDPEFGTGVVKVTPAHDASDFAIGQRHQLPMPTIFTDDGLIREGYGAFSHMKRFDARAAVIASLKELGLFVDVAEHSMVLPVCSKSKDVLEPMLKEQWYLKCAEAAKRALEAQQRGDLRLLPEGVHDGVWSRWLSDCHDWCISRQLWWGHRIPAYRLRDGSGEWVAARTNEEAAQKLGSTDIVQDDDVLDTWFSSQLFPFATLGWPAATADLDKHYPGDLLETGHDIVFFWVARMVMIGLTMTDQLPFSTVYLHAMVRDAHGRKMSKSLGNVLDPLDVIAGVSLADLHRAVDDGNLDPRERDRAKKSQAKDFPNGIPQCGTDALRFALLAYTAQARDINLDVLRVNGYRNFCNKIWQAFRFAAMFGLDADVAGELEGDLSATDRWILSRLAATATDVNEALAAYGFAAATTAIHRFWIHDLCDVYLEYMKPFQPPRPLDPLAPQWHLQCGEAAKRTLEALQQPKGVDDGVWSRYLSDCHDWCISRHQRYATVKRVLHRCLDVGLRLLHPMMPFITEELYQRLPGHWESICVAPYPLATELESWRGDEDDMGVALDLLKRLRVFRKEAGLRDLQNMAVTVTRVDAGFCDRFLEDVILPLSRCSIAEGAAGDDVIVEHHALEIRRA